MKIKKGDWIIDTKSLFSVEWKKYYPVFNVHEKYQNIIKWIIRSFTFLGIAISVVTMPWFLCLTIALILLGLDYLLENVVFLYTTIVLQEPPSFEIKHGLWISNLFLFPQYKGDLPFFCMGFTNKEYAEKLFDYFLSWNQNEHIDEKNIITINWTINKDDSYITEIFANPRRENLNQIFDEMGNASKLTKYGKRQQQFVAQMSFGQRFKSSEMVKQFIDKCKHGDKYCFAPVLVSDDGKNIIEILNKRAILKMTYNLKRNYSG